MAPLNFDRITLAQIVRRLLAIFQSDHLGFLVGLARVVISAVGSQSPGPYETISYTSTLELLDSKGRAAAFRKRQRVRFLQDHVIAFEDFAWGDGKILTHYTCAPGVVVDRYREGDRWNILVSFRETKSRGEIEEFCIERKERNAFLRRDEWMQTEIRHFTRRLQMEIIFPKGRRCRRALILQRSRNSMRVLGPDHFHPLPDGRQSVTWETTNVWPYELYTLKWQW